MLRTGSSSLAHGLLKGLLPGEPAISTSREEGSLEEDRGLSERGSSCREVVSLLDGMFPRTWYVFFVFFPCLLSLLSCPIDSGEGTSPGGDGWGLRVTDGGSGPRRSRSTSMLAVEEDAMDLMALGVEEVVRCCAEEELILGEELGLVVVEAENLEEWKWRVKYVIVEGLDMMN